MATFKNKTQAAAAARAAGSTTFTWVCETHGEGVFFSASRYCCACAAARKDPAAQAANYKRWISDPANAARHRATTARWDASPEGTESHRAAKARYRAKPEVKAAEAARRKAARVKKEE